MAKIRITQIKSGIGYTENQKQTLKALGLKGIRRCVVREDSATLRGMINTVRHLVTIEEEK